MNSSESHNPHLWFCEMDDDGSLIDAHDAGPLWPDPIADEEAIGPCVMCGQPGNVIVQHDITAPEPGKGWGCFQCHQPMNGALSLICERCEVAVLAGLLEIDRVNVGY